MRSLKAVASVPLGATLRSASTHDVQSCRNAQQSVRLSVPVRNVDEAAVKGARLWTFVEVRKSLAMSGSFPSPLGMGLLNEEGPGT
jgi:hypothetical protein